MHNKNTISNIKQLKKGLVNNMNNKMNHIYSKYKISVEHQCEIKQQAYESIINEMREKKDILEKNIEEILLEMSKNHIKLDNKLNYLEEISISENLNLEQKLGDIDTEYTQLIDDLNIITSKYESLFPKPLKIKGIKC